mmetsp:Transcript_43994/g.141029  ORF Transcript_43994/g.141029 Transcript_43994/m.141029 type:complete len:207 (-) Transcript_43994:400-1020(-)
MISGGVDGAGGPHDELTSKHAGVCGSHTQRSGGCDFIFGSSPLPVPTVGLCGKGSSFRLPFEESAAPGSCATRADSETDGARGNAANSRTTPSTAPSAGDGGARGDARASTCCFAPDVSASFICCSADTLSCVSTGRFSFEKVSARGSREEFLSGCDPDPAGNLSLDMSPLPGTHRKFDSWCGTSAGLSTRPVSRGSSLRAEGRPR